MGGLAGSGLLLCLCAANPAFLLAFCCITGREVEAAELDLRLRRDFQGAA